jgi:hypothetical protein
MIRAGQTIYIVNSGFPDNRKKVGITQLFVKRVENSGSARVLIGYDGQRYSVNGKRVNIFDRWFYSRGKAESYLKRLGSRRVVIISSPMADKDTLSRLYYQLESRLENHKDFVFVPWVPTEKQREEDELKRKVFDMGSLVPAVNLNTNELCHLRVSDKVLNKLRGIGINYRK